MTDNKLGMTNKEILAAPKHYFKSMMEEVFDDCANDPSMVAKLEDAFMAGWLLSQKQEIEDIQKLMELTTIAYIEENIRSRNDNHATH